MGQLFKFTKTELIECAKITGAFCLIGIFAEKLFRYSCSITLGYFLTLFVLEIFTKIKKMQKNTDTISIHFCKMINIFCLFIAIIDIAYIYLLFSFQKYQNLNMIFHYQWKLFILGSIISLIAFYNIYITKQEELSNIYNNNNKISKYEKIFNNARENNTDYNKSTNKDFQKKQPIIKENNNRQSNNKKNNTQENYRTNRNIRL